MDTINEFHEISLIVSALEEVGIGALNQDLWNLTEEVVTSLKRIAEKTIICREKIEKKEIISLKEGEIEILKKKLEVTGEMSMLSLENIRKAAIKKAYMPLTEKIISSLTEIGEIAATKKFVEIVKKIVISLKHIALDIISKEELEEELKKRVLERIGISLIEIWKTLENENIEREIEEVIISLERIGTVAIEKGFRNIGEKIMQFLYDTGKKQIKKDGKIEFKIISSIKDMGITAVRCNLPIAATAISFLRYLGEDAAKVHKNGTMVVITALEEIETTAEEKEEIQIRDEVAVFRNTLTDLIKEKA